MGYDHLPLCGLLDCFVAGLSYGNVAVEVGAHTVELPDGCGSPGCPDCSAILGHATFKASSGEMMLAEEYFDEDGHIQLSVQIIRE